MRQAPMREAALPATPNHCFPGQLLWLPFILSACFMPSCADDPEGKAPTQDAGQTHDAVMDPIPDAPFESNDTSSEGERDANPPDPSWGLLTLNLACFKLTGTSFGTNQERFAAVAQAVAAESVEAISVQEACVRGPDDGLETLRAELQSATGRDWFKAWAFSHVAWEGTPEEADEGVGILARWPLENEHVVTYQAQGGLQRVALGATLPTDLGSVTLYAVHLDHADAAVRVAQARETVSFALAANTPLFNVVVAGDFNDSIGSLTMDSASDFGFRDAASGLASNRIDHVFTHRGAQLDAFDAQMLFDGTTYPVVSDHRGVVARFRAGVGESVAVTRIEATVDVGWGNFLSVRGDVSPLMGGEGWPFRNVAADEWEIVLTEIPAGAPFTYSCWRNDADPQLGSDWAGVGGESHSVAPVFQ